MTDREKLIELIQHEVVPYFAERIADHLISNGVTFQQWIPVTERLPEPDKQVLAIVSGRWENIVFDRAYELVSWSADEGWIMEAWPELEDPDVSHWMPLPEPVKEG